MIKHQSLYLSAVFIVFFIAVLGGTLCLHCPALKPNSNVHVVCTNLSKNEFRCNSNDNATIGVTAAYSCEKYFKPIIKGRDGGTLNCTEEGKWTNYKIFQNFHCAFDCGIVPANKNELISHGNSTIIQNWPWVATIFRRAKDGQFKYTCGGTLIGIRTILTAAHCVTNLEMNKLPTNTFRVLLSAKSSKFAENSKDARIDIQNLSEIHVHPDYNSDSFVADIAILVLSNLVQLKEAVFPICLPRSHDHNNLALSTGNFGEIASFGIDGTGLPAKTLQHALFPVASVPKCHDVINIIPHGDQYCAGDPNGPIICRGDSGSGMVFKSTEWNEEKYSVHGIVSSTGDIANGCAPLFVATKAFSYIGWIEETIIPIENLGYIRQINEHDSTVKQKSARSRRPSQKLYSRAEREALAKLRPKVKSILLENYMQKDEYLIRFLRSKRLNLHETKNMLQNTMDWRKANRMNEILKENFTEFQNNFPTFSDSFDKDGRPVFVTLLRLWDYSNIVYSTKLPKFYRYILRNYEETEERIRAVGKPNITQCVFINDYDGFESKKHLCRLCLIVMIPLFRIFENHYPQQYFLWYMINVPTAVATAYSAFPLPSEYLVAGFRVYGTNKREWSEGLLKQIPADQLYIGYGGTKSIKQGTKRRELAL